MAKAGKPAIWCALWNVDMVGKPDAQELRSFTVAATKAEAVAAMAEGVLGLDDVEGVEHLPIQVWRVATASTDAMRGFAHYLLGKGFRFITPYSRMTADIIGDLVARLAAE